MSLGLSAVLAIAVASAVYVLTGGLLRVLKARGLLDVPDARSSHVRPTPRGGGLAVLAGVVLGVAALAPTAAVPLRLGWLFAGLVVVAAVSFYDDLRGAGPISRLAAQAIAVTVGLMALPGDGLVFQGLLPWPADWLLAGLAWLWFVNLFNFMDGIDGIAAVEAVVIGAGIAVMAAFVPLEPFLVAAALTIAAAAVGFLPWNWSPARVFLGDVGSVSLGYMLGFLLIALAVSGQWAAALILPSYYVADATLTLLTRLARGERIWEPHRSHFYQRAAARIGHSRVAVAVAVTGVALVCLAVAAETLSLLTLGLALAVVVAMLAWLDVKARA